MEEFSKIEPSRERDFARALISSGCSNVITDFFRFLEESDDAFKGIFEKLRYKELKELILMEASYFFVIFANQDSLFEQFKMKPKKIRVILEDRFKELGKEKSKYLNYFQKNVESVKKIHEFYDKNFLDIILKANPLGLASMVAFPLYHAKTYEYISESIAAIIKGYNMISPLDPINLE